MRRGALCDLPTSTEENENPISFRLKRIVCRYVLYGMVVVKNSDFSLITHSHYLGCPRNFRLKMIGNNFFCTFEEKIEKGIELIYSLEVPLIFVP